MNLILQNVYNQHLKTFFCHQEYVGIKMIGGAVSDCARENPKFYIIKSGFPATKFSSSTPAETH
jgi:hypothetical protein